MRLKADITKWVEALSFGKIGRAVDLSAEGLGSL
jgi:hypothetical protein